MANVLGKTASAASWEKAAMAKEKQYKSEARKNAKNWTGAKFKGRNADYMKTMATNLQTLRKGAMQARRRERKAK